MKHTVLRSILAVFALAGLLLAQQESPVAKQPKPKSAKEVEAINAIFQAADADARIAACNDLLIKFADTEFKVLALSFMAETYRQKGDAENMLVTAERLLEVDPKNFAGMLMIAEQLASKTKEFDLDKEEKLGRAEKLAAQAVETIKAAPRPRPDITDEQWSAARQDYTSQAYAVVGMSKAVRKKFDEAAAAYKQAAEASPKPDPVVLVRYGDALQRAGKLDEAIAAFDKALADPEASPQVKKIAVDLKLAAVKAKAEKK